MIWINTGTVFVGGLVAGLVMTFRTFGMGLLFDDQAIKGWKQWRLLAPESRVPRCSQAS